MAKDPSMVIIRGRLAADPELRTVGAQATPVVNLRILSSGWEKDTAGQPVEVTPTSWNCEAWRGQAENRQVHRAGRHGALVHPVRHRRHRRQPATRHRADHENGRRT